MSYFGMALDSDLDVMTGVNDNGFGTVVFTGGANMIIQRVVERLSLAKYQLWYQWQHGIDYELLFKNPRETFEQLRPQQIAAIRDALLSIDGVESIIGKVDIERDESNRTFRIIVPCLRIFCDNAFTEIQIGALDVD